MPIQAVEDDGTEWGAVPEGFKDLIQKPPPPIDTEAQAVTEPVEIIDTEKSGDMPTPAQAQSESTHQDIQTEPAPTPAVPTSDNVDKLIQLFAPLMSQAQSVKFQNGIALEQSAVNLMSLLSEAAQTTLKDLAHTYQVSLAEIIAGNLMLQADRGTLGDFSHSPHWREMVHISGGQSATGHTSANLTPTCPQCQLIFPADRAGQKYCCSACGKRGSGYKELGPEHDTDCKTTLATVKRQLAAKAPPVQQQSPAQQAA
jgi:hypothetical protein